MGILDDLYQALFGKNNFQDLSAPDQQPSQDQQPSEGYSFDYPINVTQIDSNGQSWRPANPFEQAVMGLKDVGSDIATDINKFLGVGNEDTGYRQDIIGDWANVIDFDQDDSGNVDAGEVLGTVPRLGMAALNTVKALPGMMVEGFSEAPAYLGAGLTGSRMTQDDAYNYENNMVKEGELTPEERAGSAIYGALDVVPVGFGSVASKVGTNIAKKAGVDLFENVADNVARQGLKQAPDAINVLTAKAAQNGLGKGLATGIGLRAGEQFLEEGAEEAVQEAGLNALNDRDLNTNVLESFIGGGLAGGAMGGLRGAKSGFQYNMKTPDWLSGEQNQTAQPQVANSFDRSLYDGSSSHGITFATVDRDLQSSMQSAAKVPGVTMGMGYNIDPGLNENEFIPGSDQLNEMIANETQFARDDDKKITNYLNGIVPGRRFADEIISANATKEGADQVYTDLNAALRALGPNDKLLDFIYFKNPGGTKGATRVSMKGVNLGSALGVSKVGAINMNADFDTDRYGLMYDYTDKYKDVKRPYELLYGNNPHENLSDLNEYLHVDSRNWSDFADKTIDALDGKINFNKNSVNNDIKNQAEFNALIKLSAANLAGIENPESVVDLSSFNEQQKQKILDLFNGEFSDFSRVMSYAYSKPIRTETASTLSVAAAEAHRESVVDRPQINSQLAELVSNIDKNPRKNHSGKEGTTSKNRMSGGGLAIIERWRQRLWVSLRDAEASCREFLSMYFYVKNYAMVWENDGHVEFTESDLISALAKYQLGIEQDGVHPENIASAVVYDGAISAMLSKGKINASNWSDCLDAFKAEYNRLRTVFFDAYNLVDQEGKPVFTDKNLMLPAIGEDNKNLMNVFAKAILDRKIDDIVQVSDSGEKLLTFREIAEDVSFSDEKMIEYTQVFSDGTNDQQVKNLITICRNRLKRDYDNASDALIKSVNDLCDDQGLRNAFAKINTDINSLSDIEGSDYIAITNALNSVGFFCGRKDFEKMGFFTNEDFFKIWKKGKNDPNHKYDTNCFVANEIVDGIQRGDSNSVINAIKIMALDSRLSKLHKMLSKMKEAEEIEDAQKVKLIDELADVSRKSPFYKSIVANIITRINISGEIRGAVDNNQVDGISRTIESIDADVVDDVEQVIAALINPETSVSDRNNLISSLSISMSEDISFNTKNVLSLMVQDETDILNMSSPSSRCRDGVKYLSLAQQQTESKLRERATFAKEKLNTYLPTDAAKTAFMQLLSTRAAINQEELSVQILQSQLTISGRYNEQARDKTKVTSAGEAAYVSNSISDIGYSTNEYQNFSQGSFSQESINSNLYISQMLFLTDYIKDIGGITIHTEDGHSEFYANKRQLIDDVVGIATGGPEDILEYADIWRLVDAVPQLFSIISPLTKTYSDSNGMLIQSFVVDKQDELTNIAKELATTGIEKIEAENRTRMTRSMVMSRVLSTAQGQYFFAATLPNYYWDAHSQKEQTKILNDHLNNTFVPWCAQYAASNEDQRKIMRRALIGRTMSTTTADMLNLAESDELDRLFYGNIDSDSLWVLRKDLQDELSGINAVSGSKAILEGVKSLLQPILEKLESENNIKEKLNDPSFVSDMQSNLKDIAKRLKAKVEGFGLSFDVDTIVGLIDPLNELSTIAAIAENSNVKEAKILLPDIFLDGYNENIEKYNNNLSQIVKELNNLEERVKQQNIAIDDEFYKLIDVIKEYINSNQEENIALGKAAILDDVNTYKDTSAIALSKIDPETTVEDFVDYAKTKLSADNYNEISKERIMKDLEEYEKNKGLTKKLKEKYGTEDFFRRSIISEILSRSAFMKIAGKYPSAEHRIDLFHGIVDIVHGMDSVLTDEELFTDLNYFWDDNVHSVSLGVDISTPDRLYRIDQFVFNMMSGNVARQTTIGASKRALFGVFAYAPQNGKWSPLVEDDTKYPPRTKREIFKEYEERIDTQKGGKAERAELYSGFYSNGKPLTRYKFDHEYTRYKNDPNKDTSTEWDTVVKCRLQADESPAYNNLNYQPDPNGGFLNQLLWILDKINLNGAEAMALKTKKNIGAFLHASFVIKSSGTKNRIDKSTARTITASNTVDAFTEFRGMIQDVKDAYIDELYEMIQGSRKPIGLTYSDLKVLADTVIQGIIIRFDDGSERAISLVDMMNGVAMLEDSDLTRISSVHVPVYDISELAKECTQRTYEVFRRSSSTRFSNKKRAQDAFIEAVAKHGTLKVYNSNESRTKGIRKVFSNIGNPIYCSTDTFIMPKNSKIVFTEEESGQSPTSSDVHSDIYNNFNRTAKIKNVVNVFGRGKLAQSLSAVNNNNMLPHRDDNAFDPEYSTFIGLDDNTSEDDIKNGISWAKKHGTSISFHSNRGIDPESIGDINSMLKGYQLHDIIKSNDGSFEGTVKVYTPIYPTPYKSTHSQASIHPFDRDNVFALAITDMDGADGETVFSLEGEQKIIKRAGSAILDPTEINFDYSGLSENGTYPMNINLIRLDRDNVTNELRNFKLDDTVATFLIKQFGIANKPDTQFVGQINDAVKEYVNCALRNDETMDTSKTYRREADSNGRFTCMGVSKVTMSDGVSYLVPMVVKTESGAKVTLQLETAMVGNKEQIIGYNAFIRRSMINDNGKFTVDKFFFPTAAIKTTGQINNPNKRYPSYKMRVSGGSGISIDGHTYIKQNGGKFDRGLALRETYSLFMRKRNASMFFIKDGDKEVIAPFLLGLHDADGVPVDEKELVKIFAEPNHPDALDIWGKIASGQYKFAYDEFDDNYNKLFMDALLSTIKFCVDSGVSPLYVLSSKMPKQVRPESAMDESSMTSWKYSNNDFMETPNTFDYGLVFGNLSTGHIQELFSHMMPDDIEPQWAGRFDSKKFYTYDKKGMSLDEANGNERQLIILTQVPNMDSTKSDWQEPGWQGAFGNKLNQMTIFAGQHGDFDMLIADNFASIGAAKEAYEMAKDIKRNRKEIYTNNGKIDNGNRSINTLSRIKSNVYVERDPVVVQQERKIRQLKSNINEKFYNAVFPIRDRNGDTVDMSVENGRFVNDEINNMYLSARDKWGFDKTKNGFRPKDFTLILKTAYAYTKEDNSSFSGFSITEVRDVIDKIASNIRQIGLPVTPDPIVNKGESSRYGICVLPQRLVSLFAENNPITQEKFTDENTGKFSLKKMQDTMLNLHIEQRTQMHNESIQRKAMIGNMATVFSRGTAIQNDTRLAQTRLGVTLAEVGQEIGNISVLWWGKDYKGWDLIDQMSKDSQAAFEREAKVINNTTLSWSKKNPNQSNVVSEPIGKWSLQKFADNIIAAKQVMSVSTPFLFPASIMDRMVMITPMRALLHSSIFGNLKGVGMDSKVQQKLGSDEDAANLAAMIPQQCKSSEFLAEFGAIKMLFNAQNMTTVIEEAKNQGKSLAGYAASMKANSTFMKKVANAAFDFASGKNVGAHFQAEVFICDLLRRISLDDRFDALWVKRDGELSEIEKLIGNPTTLMSQCFDSNCPFRTQALQAFNTAMKGDACQKTVFSILINRICQSNGAVNFFAKTFISPFMQYGINISGRHLNSILPMSALNYLVVNALKDKDAPGLVTWDQGKPMKVKWADLGIESTLTATSLRDAIVQDITHIGIIWTAAVVIGLGCLEPPDDDDDDKWCNVDEWTFMGQRISMNWWMKDTLGPVLGIACAMKSAQLGKPNMEVLIKNMTECISSNPIYRASDLVNMLFDPYGEYMEAYYEDLARYENTRDGGPSSAAEVLAANFSVAGLNWATGFILPSFVKELYTHSTDLEKSYKKVYETNAQGQLTEAGAAGKTVYTDYFDSKLRLATRKNPILAAACDFFLSPTTGYFASEMPNTVYYDPAQMESIQAYSLYTTDEYGNTVPKSDTECETIAMSVILTLQEYGDMQELRDTGFCLPYDTMKYVGDMIYDIAYAGTAQYQAALESGMLDYTVLGNGDYDLGKQRAEELAALSSNTANYWKSMYYDKLWSDEMKSGIAMYNRYNTTYAQDANGEWYATGFRNNYADLMMPWATAPDTRDQARETMGFGIEGNDWATRSVVTGESTGERALIPYTVNIKTPEFGGNKTPSGYSPTYKGFSYGYRGGGGGGGYKSRPSSYYYKVPTNTYNYVKPYGENFSTPKANTTPYKYGKELADYSFYSKGSREANKRGDM